MPRKYYPRRVNRDKYSVEQRAGTITTDAEGDGIAAIVEGTTLQGMRKVKHVTVNLACSSGDPYASVLYWALVYIPQGTDANTLNTNNANMYEPNQFVMTCGCFDFDAGPLRVHSPISRNLNSGDRIGLVIKSLVTTGVTYHFTVRYAITLQ